MDFETFWNYLNQYSPVISQITGKPSPLHSYQKYIVTLLQQKRFLMINKSRFSGLSEFSCRYMLFRILAEAIEGDSIGICSTNASLSASMARRQKKIMSDLGVYDFEDSKETVLQFPNSRIQWHASDPITLRGYTPHGLVVLDEFFHADYTADVFSVVDSFSIRSPTVQILGISTPAGQVGGGYQMWTAKESIYERVTVSADDCVNLMYTKEQLDNLIRASPSVQQEYFNRFGYSREGSTFRADAVSKSIVKEPIEFNPMARVWGGFDVGFSAPSAMCIGQLSDGYFQILFAKEFEQKNDPDFYDMVDTCAAAINEYGVEKMFIDSSAPSFISSVCEKVGQNRNYMDDIQRNKMNKLPFDTGLRVVPIPFNKFSKDMLFSAKIMLEKGGIQIPEQCTELVDFLRSAKDADGHLLKKVTSKHHIGDAFMLSMRGIELDEEVN